ncbi:hypothetical protein CUMW_225050 [Citrus unshiu]|uniref:C-JID domain-containing protein n=1 Tax=Citrus unshiu TaxID=55188 RepID=A0A2H5QFG3_CITUN|nr:hypothetical protein CUMW_225050 [Citrus unshiu]
MGLLLPITLSIDGLHMTDLTCLYLTDCGITELPESLALESLPSSGLFSIIYESSTQHFDLSGNFKLDRKEVRGIFEDALQDIQRMAAARWKQVRDEGYFLEKCGYVIFPGNEIPKWFKFQSVGSSSSITLEMPTPLPGCFRNKTESWVLHLALS